MLALTERESATLMPPYIIVTVAWSSGERGLWRLGPDGVDGDHVWVIAPRPRHHIGGTFSNTITEARDDGEMVIVAVVTEAEEAHWPVVRRGDVRAGRRGQREGQCRRTTGTHRPGGKLEEQMVIRGPKPSPRPRIYTAHISMQPVNLDILSR